MPVFSKSDSFLPIRSHFLEWVKWSDKIDAARYESPLQVVEMSEPCLQINACLSVDSSEPFLELLVQFVRTFQPAIVAEKPEIKTRFNKFKENQKGILDDYRKQIVLKSGGVAFVDLCTSGTPFQRYLVYYFHPTVDYTVTMYKRANGMVAVSVGKNPWKNFKSKDVGALCRRYGGGGHSTVGSILVDDAERANAVAESVVAYLSEG